MSAGNAALRLGAMAVLTYLDVQVVLSDPPVGWLLFSGLLATATVWTFKAYQEARDADRESVEVALDAAEDFFPGAEGIVREVHEPLWAVRR